MSVSISLKRVIICLIVSGIATLGWWIATEVIHWPVWAALWVFGFILLALSVVVQDV